MKKNTHYDQRARKKSNRGKQKDTWSDKNGGQTSSKSVQSSPRDSRKPLEKPGSQASRDPRFLIRNPKDISSINMKIWDVIVIGGGPAGLMAAGTAAERGLSVLLVEKNPDLGRKLLITGGGRCNFTNAQWDTHRLVSDYGETGAYLHSPFSRMGPRQVIDFFEHHGMPWKVEENNRAFPATDKSESVLEVLVNWVKSQSVVMLGSCRVIGLKKTMDSLTGPFQWALETNKGTFKSLDLVLATGGTARPETGSSGDAFPWLEKLGHKIHRPIPSLVPIVVREAWVEELQGLAFEDIRIKVAATERSSMMSMRSVPNVPEATVDLNNSSGDTSPASSKNISSAVSYETLRANGKVLFTHFGLSGPAILNLSSRIENLSLENPESIINISLDFFPQMDERTLDSHIQEILAGQGKRKLKNALELLEAPPRLLERILRQAGIDGEIQVSQFAKDQRKQLRQQLKNFQLTYHGLKGADWAVVSSGGVELKEVNFRSMESEVCPHLYFAGDILNFQRPSGGYSLQICWATGYSAGLSVGQTSKLSL